MNMIGRVYKIKSLIGDEVYIGSTFRRLSLRFSQHKSEFNTNKKGLSTSSYLFEKYGAETCYIELIKEYEVVDRRHLEVYEAVWIYKLKGINTYIPFNIKYLTYKQWAERHKKERAEYNKRWVEEHKEERAEYNKQWEKEHKEERDNYRSQYRRQSIRCEVCDCEVRRGTMLRHERSLKHIDNLNRNN